MPTRLGLILGAYGVAYLAIGVDLFFGVASDSDSYRYTFDWLPRPMWGAAFIIVALYVLFAGAAHFTDRIPADGRHRTIAVAATAMLATAWALGLWAAAFYGELRNAPGLALWTANAVIVVLLSGVIEKRG